MIINPDSSAYLLSKIYYIIAQWRYHFPLKELSNRLRWYSFLQEVSGDICINVLAIIDIDSNYTKGTKNRNWSEIYFLDSIFANQHIMQDILWPKL